MPATQSTIQLVPVPDLWPPLDHKLTARDGAGHVPPAPVDEGPPLPRQFAVLLVEVLAGVRPVRQLAPWLSRRGSLHLHRLTPLFTAGHQPRVLRALTTRPAPGVIEMTIVVAVGGRTRALAIRLEHDAHAGRWQCTDIESG